MKVKLHKGQYEIATDPHRFKVICAGRRWGKSVLSRLIVLKWAVENPGLYWIVSPTYQQGKDIHWMQGFKVEVPPGLVTKWNEQDLMITLRNGSVIQLKSAENPDRLKGVKLRGLIVDEIAAMRNWGWIWQEALRPTLTDYIAPALFISTPKGFNHFFDLYNTQDPSFKSWKFTSYDNPYLSKDEIEEARRTTTEDYFAQEYLADFRKYTGLVYKDFQREIHVIEPFDIPEGWVYCRGMDFGSTNPTVCLWIAIDPDDNWFVVDEYYQTGQTIDAHAGHINANTYSPKVAVTYADPSGAQWMSEFSQRGVYATPAKKEMNTSFNSWVRFGIDKVAEKLKRTPGHLVPILERGSIPEGMPRLHVFNTCVSTIKEFETYRWKEKATTQAQDLNEPDVPEKANDHAMDALRYAVVSYNPLSSKDRSTYGEDYQFINPPDLKWRIGK